MTKEEKRAKLSALRKGKKLSEATKKKISASMKGRIRGSYSECGKKFRELYNYHGQMSFKAMGNKLWCEYYKFKRRWKKEHN